MYNKEDFSFERIYNQTQRLLKLKNGLLFRYKTQQIICF